jgi:predicted ATPase
VHPWIIRNFASACRRVRAKQVLVTTHSPVLLDNVTPEEVEVAWRHDGRSLVAPMLELDPNAGELWSEGRNTVFELLDGGSLPQAVPGESL